MRRTVLLDGEWAFLTDRDERGEERYWQAADFETTDWAQVPVPGTWDSYLDGLFGYAGHAWYRRTFAVDSGWRDSRVHLRFEGANYETTVWLNGVLVGSHRGGFDPFEFDVTDGLDWEGTNTLAVRADNWPRINRVPNALAGWWNYGGIYRSVKLRALPAARIDDVTIAAEPGEGDGPAQVAIGITVVNEGTTAVTVAPEGTAIRGGALVALDRNLAAASVTLEPGARARIELSARLPGAVLWSPDDPCLYDLGLLLRAGDAVVDEIALRFGVRKLEVRGTKLYLNGEPITLTGFNRHEEYYGSGRVDPGGVLEADLRAIKEMNGNLVRMHYQAHPDMYDLCDEIGLLCFCEIPMWQIGVKDVAEWSAPEVWETTEAMIRTLVGSLKNHPSAVIWSVGNECATNRVESRPLVEHLANLCRSLDGTRPVAYVGMYGAEEKCFDLVDIPCINGYPGRNYAAFAERLAAVHALQPEKPLLMTEFGHEAVRGLRGGGYGTEDEQAAVLDGIWRVLHDHTEYMCGTIIWCLADYWHMPMGPDFHWMNRVYFCHGVLTLDRQPKLATETIKRMWSREM